MRLSRAGALLWCAYTCLLFISCTADSFHNKFLERFRVKLGETLNTQNGLQEDPKMNFYYDAANMPSWLTPPWIATSFRTGPLALPEPGDKAGNEEGPMFMGVPTQPILPFDSQLPDDVPSAGATPSNQPAEAAPTGNDAKPGKAPAVTSDSAGSTPTPTPTQFLETEVRFSSDHHRREAMRRHHENYLRTVQNVLPYAYPSYHPHLFYPPSPHRGNYVQLPSSSEDNQS